MNIRKLLLEYQDNDYKLFHQKICKTKYKILGIKIPNLKIIAKNLLNDYSYDEILDKLSYEYYEEVLLRGLIIGMSKINFEKKLVLIDSFIEKIDNWAICDTFCASLKFIKKNEDEFLNYIQKYLNNKKEYYLRFGIVILLDYYINDKYIDYILNRISKINSDYYYVKMAISWCISVCLVKYFDKTLKFLELNKNNIDKWIYNKSLQKACESLRLNNNEKFILKNMKYKL